MILCSHKHYYLLVILGKLHRQKPPLPNPEYKSESGDSTSISTEIVRNIIDRLKHERNRDSTRRNYHSIWKIFAKFYIKLNVRPDNWEDRITLFAGYLVSKKRKASTVNSYVSALKSVLRESVIEIAEDRFLLKSLMRACRYKKVYWSIGDSLFRRKYFTDYWMQLMKFSLKPINRI